MPSSCCNHEMYSSKMTFSSFRKLFTLIFALLKTQNRFGSDSRKRLDFSFGKLLGKAEVYLVSLQLNKCNSGWGKTGVCCSVTDVGCDRGHRLHSTVQGHVLSSSQGASHLGNFAPQDTMERTTSS